MTNLLERLTAQPLPAVYKSCVAAPATTKKAVDRIMTDASMSRRERAEIAVSTLITALHVGLGKTPPSAKEVAGWLNPPKEDPPRDRRYGDRFMDVPEATS